MNLYTNRTSENEIVIAVNPSVISDVFCVLSFATFPVISIAMIRRECNVDGLFARTCLLDDSVEKICIYLRFYVRISIGKVH